MGLATWYDVAYYALLGLNAKNSIPCCIQVLGQQCGSQPRNRKRRSANGQAVPRNPITSEDQPKWSCHQWSSRPCNVILCATNGQARTQHVPVFKRYIAVAAEWRLTSFVLLWSTLGVQRLKMSYVGSCHKLSVPWLLVFQRDRFVNAHPHHNNIRHPSRENVSHGDADSAMNDHFKRQVILLKHWTSYIILWFLMVENVWKNIHRHPKQPSPIYPFPASSAVVTGRCGHPSLRTGFQKLRYAMGAWHLNVNVAASEILWPQIWNQRKIVHT